MPKCAKRVCCVLLLLTFAALLYAAMFLWLTMRVPDSISVLLGCVAVMGLTAAGLALDSDVKGGQK